jgi:hypothetical protein
MDPRVTDTRIRLVRNDTGPQIQLTLTNEATGAAIDLSSATATMHFKSVTTGTVVFSRALSIPALTAAQGIAIVVWGATDLNQTAGDYDGEVEITFPTGMRQTVYDVLKFRLRDQFA